MAKAKGGEGTASKKITPQDLDNLAEERGLDEETLATLYWVFGFEKKDS